MKDETKKKIEVFYSNAKAKAKKYAPFVLIYGGLIAIVRGSIKGSQSAKRCDKLERQHEEMCKYVIANRLTDQERMLNLERQQNELLEKALKITEGAE